MGHERTGWGDRHTLFLHFLCFFRVRFFFHYLFTVYVSKTVELKTGVKQDRGHACQAAPLQLGSESFIHTSTVAPHVPSSSGEYQTWTIPWALHLLGMELIRPLIRPLIPSGVCFTPRLSANSYQNHSRRPACHGFM
ncbi:hypothetical protein L211DRAFT_842562 [Terfezia boudieri ATCC MYA-4762]|uniref:Uncharacterized protein n=1 Tax=Terfezia boudieri ATCC MYA-4762 TaxID=1051890 RepID=A0A3N4L9A9_9PEZI|nr:hypothetical protein L211DRAFT_842562 [Terfezia boudieri ATCC MYA-4762]